jgi:signal transduction histidine kinase/ligand-binding sensor domain-containing protein
MCVPMRSSLAGRLIRFFLAAACCAFPLLPAGAFASTKPLTEYTQTVWTHKDGLPSAFIYSMAQTQDGYLWLATADGLVQFDGVRFTHWRSKTGHRARLGAVLTLCAARDGTLWVGTASGLIGHVNGSDLTTSFVGPAIQAMLEDPTGTLWVIAGDQLLRFRGQAQEQIGSAIALPAPFLSGLLQDKNGSIWFSTDSGLLRLDPRDPQVRFVKITKGKFWLSEDARGIIWITRPDGSTRTIDESQVSSGSGTIKTLDIHTVLRDGEGNTWIGTLGEGLARLRGNSDYLRNMESFSQPDGLSGDSVWCLLEDREHNIWVGTQSGLNRFRDEKIATLTRREGLASDTVDALAAGTEGAVWASTSVGIDRIDAEHRDLYLEGDIALGLSMDPENILWAGTNRGVARRENGKWSSLSLPNGIQLQDVTVIAQDYERGVWLFDVRKGLFRWLNGRLTDFSNEPLLKGKLIFAARGDSKGKVWFGLNRGGVLVFDAGHFHSYSESDGLPGGFIDAVYVDDEGTVWIGSERGLSRLEGQRFATWNSANGLPEDRVLWILSDSARRIWVGYVTGVARVTRSELDWAERDPSHAVNYRFLDDGDGLKGNPDRGSQSAAVRASDGKLWLRTSEGVAIVDPQDLTRNLVVPPVHVQRLVADGATLDMTQPVRLRPLTREVQIDYTALSFAEPRKVRFRYKLEGFDQDWRDAGTRRQAFYTNLSPRAYRFRVLACNNDGIWNESGATLDFDLLPAFYQTRGFLLLCALVLIILAFSVYRLRVWQVTSSFRDRFEERLKERTRIAQELHDNLIQDVMGISLQIEVSDELLPPHFPAKESLRRALRLCKSALDEGRRALNDLRSAPLSADDFVKSFSQLSEQFAGHSGTRVDVVVEGRERSLSVVAGNDLLQIGRQAIMNAFQHSRAKKIHVLLSYGQQDLQIRVKDNGCGMTEEKLNSRRSGHYGIAGMQERAERLGGTLSIRSRVGQGTEVSVSAPGSIVYKDDLPRSGSGLVDKWHMLILKLGLQRIKANSAPPGTSAGGRPQSGKPDETDS